MKTNLISLILFFLFLCPLFIFSQIPNQDKGRFYTTEGYEIKFKSLQEKDNLIIYKKTDGRIATIEKSEILRIDAQTGNEALKWGTVSLGASLVGVGIGLIAANRYQRIDGQTINKKVRNSFIIGYTTIFTSIGIIIGSSKKKYKTIFDNPSYSSRLQTWQINTTSINNRPALGLTIRF